MTYQHFWRCEHHPNAMDNFFEKRTTCEWQCHTQPVLWYHNGFSPMPKSWGGMPMGNPNRISAG